MKGSEYKMITIYNNKHLTWDGNVSINHYELFVDSALELPTAKADIYALIGAGYKMAQGSLAYVVTTSEMYMLNSSGQWILQE